MALHNSVYVQDEKFALIRDVVNAVPELDLIYLLYEGFVTRCPGSLGNVVHVPIFLKQAKVFCGCLVLVPSEAQVLALSNTISMDTLACHLLAVRMSFSRALSVFSHSLP